MALILIDASAFIWRAFYALPPLQRTDGTPTGAVHGWCEMLWKLLDRQDDATHIGAVFDASRRSFRHDLYPEYKATRRETPEALRPQFELVKQATIAFGLPVIESEGFEADDLLASYAEHAKTQGMTTEIVGVDKDLMQLLVDESVYMWCPLKKRLIDRDDVIAKLGVGPEQAIDAQALIGDPVDNVPGVTGIGPKKAGELLKQYGTLENVMANAANIKLNSMRASLLLPANQKKALLSKELVTLKRDVPLPIPFERLAYKGVDKAAVLAFAETMEFVSFVDTVEKQAA
jgi:DNA polymerase-1